MEKKQQTDTITSNSNSNNNSKHVKHSSNAAHSASQQQQQGNPSQQQQGQNIIQQNQNSSLNQQQQQQQQYIAIPPQQQQHMMTMNAGGYPMMHPGIPSSATTMTNQTIPSISHPMSGPTSPLFPSPNMIPQMTYNPGFYATPQLLPPSAIPSVQYSYGNQNNMATNPPMRQQGYANVPQNYQQSQQGYSYNQQYGKNNQYYSGVIKQNDIVQNNENQIENDYDESEQDRLNNFHLQGGDSSGYGMGMHHDDKKSMQLQPADKFKTELCKKFMSFGYCRYGDKCQFAHGMAELRVGNRPKLYKTSRCKSFQETGYCKYGDRCIFVHDESEGELALIHQGVPVVHNRPRDAHSPVLQPQLIPQTQPSTHFSLPNQYQSNYAYQQQQSFDIPATMQNAIAVDDSRSHAVSHELPPSPHRSKPNGNNNINQQASKSASNATNKKKRQLFPRVQTAPSNLEKMLESITLNDLLNENDPEPKIPYSRSTIFETIPTSMSSDSIGQIKTGRSLRPNNSSFSSHEPLSNRYDSTENNKILNETRSMQGGRSPSSSFTAGDDNTDSGAYHDKFNPFPISVSAVDIPSRTNSGFFESIDWSTKQLSPREYHALKQRLGGNDQKLSIGIHQSLSHPEMHFTSKSPTSLNKNNHDDFGDGDDNNHRSNNGIDSNSNYKMRKGNENMYHQQQQQDTFQFIPASNSMSSLHHTATGSSPGLKPKKSGGKSVNLLDFHTSSNFKEEDLKSSSVPLSSPPGVTFDDDNNTDIDDSIVDNLFTPTLSMRKAASIAHLAGLPQSLSVDHNLNNGFGYSSPGRKGNLSTSSSTSNLPETSMLPNLGYRLSERKKTSSPAAFNNNSTNNEMDNKGSDRLDFFRTISDPEMQKTFAGPIAQSMQEVNASTSNQLLESTKTPPPGDDFVFGDEE